MPRFLKNFPLIVNKNCYVCGLKNFCDILLYIYSGFSIKTTLFVESIDSEEYALCHSQ